MQTSRKQSYGVLKKTQSSYSHLLKNPTVKKKSCYTQTETTENQYDFRNLFELNEGFQGNYIKALSFVNECHELMSKIFTANYNENGDSETNSKNLFKIPNIPNYLTIVHLFLSKSDQIPVNINDITESTIIQNKNTEIHNQPKKSSEGTVISEKTDQAFAKMSNCKNVSGPDTKIISSKSKPNIINPSNTKRCKTDFTTKIPAVKIKKPSGEKLTELIKQEIKKEVQEIFNNETKIIFEKYGTVIDQTNLEPLNKLSDTSIQKSIQNADIFVKDFSKINEDIKKQEQYSKNVDDETFCKRIISDIISPDNLDLMEYTQRKLKNAALNNSQHSLKCKVTFSDCTLSQQESTEPVFKNLGKLPATNEKLEMDEVRRSCITTAPSNSTEKVNQMFQKISKESLHSQKEALFNDENDLVNNKNGFNNSVYDQTDVVYQQNNSICNHNNDVVYDFIPHCDGPIICHKLIDRNTANDSDNDSIYSDEIYLNQYTNIDKQNKSTTIQHLVHTFNSADSMVSEQSVGSSKFKRCHPLQPTQRDLKTVDESILKTIGIFTTKGFVKPEVINTIELKEKMGTFLKNQKNKEFRTKRTIDFQLRYNSRPNKNEEISSEGSFSLKSAVSYSTESISKSELCENVLLNSAT